jgi:hypothetical protein
MSALVAKPLGSMPTTKEPAVSPSSTASLPSSGSEPAAILLEPDVSAPFATIRSLFDHLRSNPKDANALNVIYPKRGIFKTAASQNTVSDQKFTIDLSPSRSDLLPPALRKSLSVHGLEEVLHFFTKVETNYVDRIMSLVNTLAGADLASAHAKRNFNFRLCDYNADTADPDSENGCGTHTDYGTFSIIFQDGTSGLELEDPKAPGEWIPVPGDKTVVLAGWCAVVLSGGRITATRHRVRRVPSVRRLSAVLFVAPDLDVTLQPAKGIEPVCAFSEAITKGEITVEGFKEIMGKKWRHREDNGELSEEEKQKSQDSEIEGLVGAKNTC